MRKLVYKLGMPIFTSYMILGNAWFYTHIKVRNIENSVEYLKKKYPYI